MNNQSHGRDMDKEMRDVTQMCYNDSHRKGVSLRATNARDRVINIEKVTTMDDYSTTNQDDDKHLCTHCKTAKPKIEFPIKKSGDPWKICFECKRKVNRHTGTKSKTRLTSGTVYFVLAVGTNLVKIGFTSNIVTERVRLMQGMSPLPLLLLEAIPGTIMDEYNLHIRYQAFNDHDEWYCLKGDFFAFINGLALKRTEFAHSQEARDG